MRKEHINSGHIIEKIASITKSPKYLLSPQMQNPHDYVVEKLCETIYNSLAFESDHHKFDWNEDKDDLVAIE